MKPLNRITSHDQARGSFFPVLLMSILACMQLVWISPCSGATVYVDADPKQVVGVEFSLRVSVDTVSDLYGVAFDLIYDPDFLQVVDSDMDEEGSQPKITEGLLLNSAGSDPTIARAALEDDAPGTLVVGLTRSGDVAGVDSSAEAWILSVHFIPRKAGETSIHFSRQGLKNSMKETIEVSAWGEISLTFVAQGDVDCDLTVDLKDAVLALQTLARRFPNKDYCAQGDVNGNGRLDMADVIYILQRISEMRTSSGQP